MISDSLYLRNAILTELHVNSESGDLIGQTWKMLDQDTYTETSGGTSIDRAGVLAAMSDSGSIYDSFEFLEGDGTHVLILGTFTQVALDFILDTDANGTDLQATANAFAGINNTTLEAFNGSHASTDYAQFVSADGQLLYYETLYFVNSKNPFLPLGFLRRYAAADGALEPFNDLLYGIHSMPFEWGNSYWRLFYKVVGNAVEPIHTDAEVDKQLLLSGKHYVRESFDCIAIQAYVWKGVRPNG